MNLHQIFTKPIDRPIEGVIKADDMEQIRLEVDEYVITNEIAKRLSKFFDAYNNYQGANGVWISGFFGSGKSHLLKMLALLMENKTINGSSMLEMFQPKCEDDAMLKGAMQKAVSIPSKSILFNIDQKAVTISKQEVDAVLHVFMKVFNEMQGYYGKQGYVAQFERELDENGQYQAFKEVYPEIAGHSWEKGREQVILDSKQGFVAQVYAHVTGKPEKDVQGIIDNYRDDYKVSIEDFAEMVHEYVEKQAPGFRLNFFVDEVGQYVADHVKLMTNLQTIAESLATRCKGQAWLIVTAQEDMDTVMGEYGQQQSDDFSKIMDRFQTRMKLTSANVDEVIQKRLLKKNKEAKSELGKIYRREKNNFGTLFTFSDSTMQYRKYRDRDDFISNYPFVPYQFDLFQSALIGLSQHNAFEGQHSSVGERSMLGVFQQVINQISDRELGTLASFDLMFEGIRTALKGQTQHSIQQAEKNLDDAFAIRVLKALFLVKYVKEFTASPRNLRILLQDRFGMDIPEQQERIKEALRTLENQSFIQRTGDEYEYLTDEERDIEEEIKNTHIDESQMVDEIGNIVFNEVIQHRKLRYEPTKQDFDFTKKWDDRIQGREKELTIHLITPLHDQSENISVLQGNSMGKAEMMVVMPSDPRLIQDLRMYKKTVKYIRQNQKSTQQETVQRILSEKSFQNNRRQETIRKRIRELLSEAKIIVSGNDIQVNGSDPLTRIHNGFDYLIQTTYTNLNMIQGMEYRESDIPQYLEVTQEGLFSGEDVELNEAEQEVLAFIKRGKGDALRTTLKKVEDAFTTKPYGWKLDAVQCIMAKLCGKGKVELRADGNLLEDEEIENALLNTRRYANVVVNPQIDFTAGQKRRLKDFFGQFFDRPPEATDARSLGKETREAFQQKLHELKQLRVNNEDRFPFLAALEKPIETFQKLGGENYTYFLTDLYQEEDELFRMKEEIIDPIQRFMGGANRQIFTEALGYLDRQQPNFEYVSSDAPDKLREIKEDPDVYRGDQIRQAKQLLDDLEEDVSNRLEKEKARATSEIKSLKEQFKSQDNFGKLEEKDAERFIARFDQAIQRIQTQTLIPVIRDTVRNFQDMKFAHMLEKMDALVEGTDGPEPPKQVIQFQMLPNVERNKILENEEQVDKHLKKIKKAIIKAIEDGKKVLF